MKHSIYSLFSILMLSLVMIACGNQSKKDNQKTKENNETAMQVGHQVIFENDYVKAVKVSLNPGEVLKPHQGEERVIYSLTDYEIEWEENGKNEGQKSWKKGDIHTHKAGQHSAKNNGKSKAEWVAFVRKESTLPDCDEELIENDVYSVSKDFAVQRLDDTSFRITEVKLPKSERIPMHDGLNRIIFSLSDYKVAYTTEDQNNTDKQFESGDVHWHEACKHAINNIGQTDAKFLVIAFKK